MKLTPLQNEDRSRGRAGKGTWEIRAVLLIPHANFIPLAPSSSNADPDTACDRDNHDHEGRSSTIVRGGKGMSSLLQMMKAHTANNTKKTMGKISSKTLLKWCPGSIDKRMKHLFNGNRHRFCKMKPSLWPLWLGQPNEMVMEQTCNAFVMQPLARRDRTKEGECVSSSTWNRQVAAE
eukprot:jgi/Bigna1/76184/fgenesh1_pg.39_\